jgi:16S rRNA (cytosine967-C5)-methyltransferase
MLAYSHLIRETSAHAVVNEGAELARSIIGERAVGFVNAILRKYVQRTQIDWIQILNDDIEVSNKDAVRYSLPDWIFSYFSSAVPTKEKLERLLNVLNEPPKVTYLNPPGNKNQLSGYQSGDWSFYSLRNGSKLKVSQNVLNSKLIVQDEGSQLVAQATVLAEVQGSDENWLDMTAGPGGKSIFLGSVAKKRGAKLTANELHPHRGNLIASTAQRLGLEIDVTVGDALTQPWKSKFDRTLLDAPCTGLGALRRRAESRWRRNEKDLVELVDLQKKLLIKAIKVTRSGGVVAYTTCSLHPRETVEVVDFAQRIMSFTLVDATEILSWVPMQAGPFVHLWPHIHGTDGMFLAILKVD